MRFRAAADIFRAIKQILNAIAVATADRIANAPTKARTANIQGLLRRRQQIGTHGSTLDRKLVPTSEFPLEFVAVSVRILTHFFSYSKRFLQIAPLLRVGRHARNPNDPLPLLFVELPFAAINRAELNARFK
jgi:hypothetical protein